MLVERHYLLTLGGSFTENFYGLKRERVLRIKGGEAPRARMGAPALMRETLKSRKKDIWANLAILVGLPYVKRKLDESFEIHAPQTVIQGPSYNRDTLPYDATIRQRIMWYYKWFLRNIYPSINAAYYFSLLAFNLAYLFDTSKYSSPFLWLVGTRIRRMNDADHRAIALAEQQATSYVRPGARPGQSNSVFTPATIGRAVNSSLRLLLPTSIFALKFLEWWHASDFATQLSRKAAEGLDLPPPVVSGLPSNKPLGGASAHERRQSPTAVTPTTTNTVSLSSPAPPLPPPASPQTPSSSSPANPNNLFKPCPPISSFTQLPILTVPPPRPSTSPLCPICLSPVQTPTAAQTGYVFCYTCIFKWVDGSHERQQQFMEGKSGGIEGWGDEEEDDPEDEKKAEGERRNRSRVGKWESGKGRCAVTGRRVLGGTEGLRRVMV